MILVAVCAMVLAGLAPRGMCPRCRAKRRCAVVAQQTDEVEVIARLLASKMEQSQKVLRTMAAGVTPRMQDSSFLTTSGSTLRCPPWAF